MLLFKINFTFTFVLNISIIVMQLLLLEQQKNKVVVVHQKHPAQVYKCLQYRIKCWRLMASTPSMLSLTLPWLDLINHHSVFPFTKTYRQLHLWPWVRHCPHIYVQISLLRNLCLENVDSKAEQHIWYLVLLWMMLLLEHVVTLQCRNAVDIDTVYRWVYPV